MCLISRFDGVVLSSDWKEALLDKFVTGAPRPRTPSALQYSDRKHRAEALSKEHGINSTTVAKWRKRATVEDLKTGPKEPRSTVLNEAEEAMVVAFRRHALLPLDDCLYALQASLLHLTRSTLHRFEGVPVVRTDWRILVCSSQMSFMPPVCRLHLPEAK